MLLRQLFDHDTWTYTYLIADPETGDAALIDPVFEQVERDINLIGELGLSLRYVLETHVHADHVTGAAALRDRTDCRTVGAVNGASCADLKLAHGHKLPLGNLTIEVLETPGHTDDSLSFRVDGEVFTGDALFVRGTGRTDFQNGDPGTLYDSLTQVLFALPDDTRVWPGHDYKGQTVSTIGEEKRLNPRLADNDRDGFIRLMNNLNLPRPKYIDKAVPANRMCGEAQAHQGGHSAVHEVTAERLSSLPVGTRVIDVREPAEFDGELGHLERAELVPQATLEQVSQGWDRRAPVMLVCRSGRRSRNVAETLVANGFERVMNLSGGMLAVREMEQRRAS